MKNSIEEDIKIALDKFSDNKDIDSAILIVEKFILGNYILKGGRTNIVKDSLRYILSDYKRVLKENEEIKENCKKCIIRDELDEYVNNSVPVQKIKDKIEELKEEKEEYYSREKIEELDDKIQVLQELL